MKPSFFIAVAVLVLFGPWILEIWESRKKTLKFKEKIKGMLASCEPVFVEWLPERRYQVAIKVEENVVQLRAVTEDDVPLHRKALVRVPERMYKNLKQGEVYEIDYDISENEVRYKFDGQIFIARSLIPTDASDFKDLPFARRAMEDFM